MVQRCYNPKNPSYKDYWGRWIKIERPSEYEFYIDMRETYYDDLSIDRIDVNGNYCKSNCRWATKEIQHYNKRNSIFIEYFNKIDTIKNWCKILNISESKLRRDIKLYGKDRLSIEKLFNKYQKELWKNI